MFKFISDALGNAVVGFFLLAFSIQYICKALIWIILMAADGLAWLDSIRF